MTPASSYLGSIEDQPTTRRGGQEVLVGQSRRTFSAASTRCVADETRGGSIVNLSSISWHSRRGHQILRLQRLQGRRAGCDQVGRDPRRAPQAGSVQMQSGHPAFYARQRWSDEHFWRRPAGPRSREAQLARDIRSDGSARRRSCRTLRYMLSGRIALRHRLGNSPSTAGNTAARIERERLAARARPHPARRSLRFRSQR